MFSTKHRLVIYPDGIARETMHFIAGLLGDQQVYKQQILSLLSDFMFFIVLTVLRLLMCGFYLFDFTNL